jgi:hypothetical protein
VPPFYCLVRHCGQHGSRAHWVAQHIFGHMTLGKWPQEDIEDYGPRATPK